METQLLKENLWHKNFNKVPTKYTLLFNLLLVFQQLNTFKTTGA